MPRFLLVALSIGFLASGCARVQPADDDLGSVAEFSLTERSGRKVSREDLLGKVWVASFLFTRCSTGCPLISAHLMELQKDLEKQQGVVLVTFSVDPEHDQPEVLQEYADSHGADSDRWLFLTGRQEEVYHLVYDSFHLPMQQTTGKERTPGNEVSHATRLVLVDKRGRIRGYFEGKEGSDLPKLRERIGALLREKP